MNNISFGNAVVAKSKQFTLIHDLNNNKDSNYAYHRYGNIHEPKKDCYKALLTDGVHKETIEAVDKLIIHASNELDGNLQNGLISLKKKLVKLIANSADKYELKNNEDLKNLPIYKDGFIA